MFISIKFTETSIDKTNKIHQKVLGSKFMYRMSTIHTNTCTQMTTPLYNRWHDVGFISITQYHDMIVHSSTLRYRDAHMSDDIVHERTSQLVHCSLAQTEFTAQMHART